MLNTLVLIGRICQLPELRETSGGNKFAKLGLLLERNFANSQGIYETDVMECTLWRGIAETTMAHCTLGAVVAVKGRLQTRVLESKEGKNFTVYEIIAEMVTFITRGEEGKEDV